MSAGAITILRNRPEPRLKAIRQENTPHFTSDCCISATAFADESSYILTARARALASEMKTLRDQREADKWLEMAK